jgi:hypothetical protein
MELSFRESGCCGDPGIRSDDMGILEERQLAKEDEPSVLPNVPCLLQPFASQSSSSERKEVYEPPSSGRRRQFGFFIASTNFEEEVDSSEVSFRDKAGAERVTSLDSSVDDNVWSVLEMKREEMPQ